MLIVTDLEGASVWIYARHVCAVTVDRLQRTVIHTSDGETYTVQELATIVAELVRQNGM